MPFIGEFARSIGIDPKTVFQAIAPMLPGIGAAGLPGGQGGPGQPTAMDQVGSALGNAESMRSQAGGLGAAARGQSQVSMAGAQP